MSNFLPNVTSVSSWLQDRPVSQEEWTGQKRGIQRTCSCTIYQPVRKYFSILTTVTTVLMHICWVLVCPKEWEKWHTLDLTTLDLSSQKGRKILSIVWCLLSNLFPFRFYKEWWVMSSPFDIFLSSSPLFLFSKTLRSLGVWKCGFYQCLFSMPIIAMLI